MTRQPSRPSARLPALHAQLPSTIDAGPAGCGPHPSQGGWGRQAWDEGRKRRADLQIMFHKLPRYLNFLTVNTYSCVYIIQCILNLYI